LNRYVAAYCDENDTDDLLTAVARDSEHVEPGASLPIDFKKAAGRVVTR